MNEALYPTVGGRLVVEGSGDMVWDFGWIPPQWRSEEQQREVDEIAQALPAFAIDGDPHDDVDRADLTKLWKHPKVVEALGFPYTGTHQLTGSCVGAGGGNVAFSLAAQEVLGAGQAERIILPFYPYTYGRSRYHSGMRGRGEGSTGTGWAKAAVQDGVLDNAMQGLPPLKSHDDGLVWGADVEMAWSAGDRIEESWLKEGRIHVIKTAAPCKDSQDVMRALVNGYPCTCASMYAFKARVEGEGEDACLLGRKQGQWSHQMSYQAYWNHRKFGPLYWLMNQWGLSAHGTCPTGMPQGGAWVTAADVDWVCRTGEVFAFSQFDGYPSREIDWFI